MRFYKTEQVNNKGVYTYEKQDPIIVHQFQRFDKGKGQKPGMSSTATGVIVSIVNLNRDDLIIDDNDKVYVIVDVNYSPIGLNRYSIKAKAQRG